MQNNNQFRYIKSVDDFQIINQLLDKLYKEFEVYQNTKAATEQISQATTTQADSFVSKLSNEDLYKLLAYFKQHYDYYLKFYSNLNSSPERQFNFPPDYSCFDLSQSKDSKDKDKIWKNHNCFGQFAITFCKVLNKRIVQNYLNEETLRNQKPQEIIDYLMHHMMHSQ